MIIENPQSQLSRGEINTPKIDLKQRCADLDLEIPSIKKTLEILKARREDAQMLEQRRKSLDRIYADMEKKERRVLGVKLFEKSGDTSLEESLRNRG